MNIQIFGTKKCNDTKKAETRYCAELPEEFISQKCELLGLVGLVLLRLPGNKNVYRSYMVWLNDVFGKAVAKYAIRHNAAAVIMYDTTATECFKYLKQNYLCFYLSLLNKR